MKVLIACEFSGIVRDAFKAKGHDAWSCDILPTEILGNHYQSDVIPLLDLRWDLIIAHPPCTFLSNAGACRLYPTKGNVDVDRYNKGLKAKDFFMKFYNSDCKKVAIENPVSSKIFKMPQWTQEIQPYHFGHPFTKKTRLWLKGLPYLKPQNEVEPIGPYLPAGTGRKNPEKYGFAKRKGGDAINRSRTFQGIAEAMAEQWGAI